MALSGSDGLFWLRGMSHLDLQGWHMREVWDVHICCEMAWPSLQLYRYMTIELDGRPGPAFQVRQMAALNWYRLWHGMGLGPSYLFW